MHKHGGDIYSNENMIDFSANLNPLGMPAFVVEASKNAVEKASVYPDVSAKALKVAIEEREGVGIENILCTNGAAELIFAVSFALKPKKAIVLCPSFQEYRQSLEAAGCEIENYYLREDFALGEEFLQVLTKEVDMVFLCTPNNPTGICIEKGLLEKIIKKTEENGIFLVLDLCFSDFLEEEVKVNLSSNMLVLKAFTKMYAMAGIRLGYGLCSNKIVMEKIIGCIQPWSVSVIAQEAGVVAAKDRAFVAQTKALIKKEKALLLGEMPKYVEKIYGSAANYIFFKTREDLYEKMKEKGILIRDCSNFVGLKKGYFRIAIKGAEDNKKFLNALREVTNG